MSRFLKADLSALEPYTPGEQPKDWVYIKLNTNEMPYPPSPTAVSYVANEVSRLNLYPDPTCHDLTVALAKTLGAEENQVILGNGSDEILFYAFTAFCDSKTKAAFPNITYGFYKVFAQLCGIKYTEIPLTENFEISINDYKNTDKTIFIANPNAPTGIALSTAQIEEIIKSNPDNIVVIDEAYVDFGGESCVPLIKKYDNLLVVQTFSKSRSMAGARLGMGIGSAELINDLNRVKYSTNPYNINRMTLAAGLGTLTDGLYTEECCEKIIENREFAEKELSKLGFTFTKSSANFIFAKHELVTGAEIYRKLKERKILVRHFNSPLITDYNRITVGTREQMTALITALKEILEEIV